MMRHDFFGRSTPLVTIATAFLSTVVMILFLIAGVAIVVVALLVGVACTIQNAQLRQVGTGIAVGCAAALAIVVVVVAVHW